MITSREILSFSVFRVFSLFNVFMFFPHFYARFVSMCHGTINLIILSEVICNNLLFYYIIKFLNHPAYFRCRFYFVHGVDVYAIHAVFLQVADLSHRIVDAGLAHILLVFTVCGD